MGLDMYLTARRSFWSFDEDDQKYIDTLKNLFPEYDQMNPTSICFEAAYWRKANAIHKWFVDNVQDGKDDCSEYYVSTDQLKDLFSVCEQVIADKSKAEELLPSASGYFFGSTDYDEYYFQDVQFTIDKLKNIVDNANYELCSFFYQSSW